MDINGFREAQSPWFFSQPPEYLVETRVNKLEAPVRHTAPTPDNRYAGWAAPMEDGRVSTDYRPKCAARAAAGTQFATRRFMQHNAVSIMNLSQKRQAEQTGAGRSYMVTEPPPVAFAKCSPEACHYTDVNGSGIGISRKERVPELFGTFAQSIPHSSVKDQPMLTMYYEGGRNSIRG